MPTAWPSGAAGYHLPRLHLAWLRACRLASWGWNDARSLPRYRLLPPTQASDLTAVDHRPLSQSQVRVGLERWWEAAEWESRTNNSRFFIYFFYHVFAKIYGPPESLQNYTSSAVVHDVRNITPWPTAVGAASSGPVVRDRYSVVTHGVMSIALWATVLCPSAMGHRGSRPPSAVGHDARTPLPI
jgi:hypothetical protein